MIKTPNHNKKICPNFQTHYKIICWIHNVLHIEFHIIYVYRDLNKWKIQSKILYYQGHLFLGKVLTL